MDLKQFTQTQEDLGYNLDSQRINEAWERFKTTNRTKNKVQNYNEINLTEQKRTRTNKMLDLVAHLAIIGASILATLIYIQNY